MPITQKQKDYHKEYYKNNKEKLLKYGREWNAKNKDYYKSPKMIKKRKGYNSKPKMKEYHKEYYKNNKEKLLKYGREWNAKNKGYHNNPERIKKRKEYNARPETKERKKNSWLKYRPIRHKKVLMQKYGLTIEEYKTITKKCALCNFNTYSVDLHHIDFDSNNNNKENFIGLCPNCHWGIHRKKFRISKEELLSKRV